MVEPRLLMTRPRSGKKFSICVAKLGSIAASGSCVFQPRNRSRDNPAPSLPLRGLVLMRNRYGVLKFTHQNTRVEPL